MSSTVNKPSHPEIEDTVNSTTPLMADKNEKKTASLATPDSDESDNNREVANKPTSGANGADTRNQNTRTDQTDNLTNSMGSERNPTVHSNDSKVNNSSEGSEDDHHRRNSVTYPHFPHESDYNHLHRHDMETASILLEDIPDLNVYQHKKTLAQGMMDLALFSANANQLRYVLDSYERHPYYYPSLIFIIISLFLQVAIGILLIWNATYNVKDEKQVCRANKINNYTVIGIFLVTVVNVFVSAFGVADPPGLTATVVTNAT